MSRTSKFVSFSFALAATLVACGDNDPGNEQVDARPAVDAPTAPLQVSLAFGAKVAGTAFACGQTYTVGSASSAYVASDFRFYVHDVKLVGAGGEVDLTMDTNGFQAAGVALLDFETGGVGCQMGSTETHTAITGTVPAGTYTGIKFKVGVPYDQNHLDVTTAVAPLNVPAMYWAWSSGHRFLKADGAVSGSGFNLHLGSTGCTTMGTTPPTGPCTSPNVMEVTLPGYTLGTSVIVADSARVLDGVDVSTNTTMTAPGCMSFPGDPECDLVIPKLGLAYGTTPAVTQTLFALE